MRRRRHREPKREEVKKEEIVLNLTPCKVCGKPATIISPKVNPYCCLACQTNSGE